MRAEAVSGLGTTDSGTLLLLEESLFHKGHVACGTHGHTHLAVFQLWLCVFLLPDARMLLTSLGGGDLGSVITTTMWCWSAARPWPALILSQSWP